MASCHYILCLALILALSFSTLEMALGARSLATTTNSGGQAEKHIPLPQFKVPYKKPIFKLSPKKPVTLPKVTLHPSHPKSQNGLDQSLFPSFPRSFNIPSNFNFPPFAPYLSNPDIPFPDLPLVPVIPLTPPSLPVTPSSTSKKANDQSP